MGSGNEKVVFLGGYDIPSLNAPPENKSIFPEWYHGPEFRSYYEMPAVSMSAEPSRKKHIYVPKSDVQDAMKRVVEKHLGGALPEDTKVTNNWTTPDKWCIEIDSQEFPQNPDDKTSQELKPRKH